LVRSPLAAINEGNKVIDNKVKEHVQGVLSNRFTITSKPTLRAAHRQ
jgi:hypothetical protein